MAAKRAPKAYKQPKPTNPYIRRDMDAHKRSINTPLRPYDGRGSNSQSKAIEYATWLAERDGVSTAGLAQVMFVPVSVHGYSSPVQRATAVYFGSVKIELPHWNFDDTLPAVDCSDAPLLLAAE